MAAIGVTVGHAEAPAGTFGFVASIDADGFFDPVLRTVTIQKVEPGLPAAMAGIRVGDTITEVEGRQVAGAKAKALEPLMRKHVGETLSLKLRRAGGESYSVSMIAAARR